MLRTILGYILYILVIIGLTWMIVTFVGQRTRVSGRVDGDDTAGGGDNLIVRIRYLIVSMTRRAMILSYFHTNMKKIHFISNELSDCRVRLSR